MSARAGVAVCAALALLAASLPAAAYQRPGRTERVSVASDGTQGDRNSERPVVSADGRYVAFASFARNLAPGDPQHWDVYVHDRGSGATVRVSVASDGTQGNGDSLTPSISADGRYVAFTSAASNLVDGDTNGRQDVFVHDRETGVTERVSVASDGTQGNGNSLAASVSADGRYVGFHSAASNLVDGDTNGVQDVFVHDRETGVTERVSVASDGTEANASSAGPSVSADGRYVAFSSSAWNLVTRTISLSQHVYVRDRQAGVTERVSVASDGTPGDRDSFTASISADGRQVAFASFATNLVPGEPAGTRDSFVHDRETRVTERVSVSSDGAAGNWDSSTPAISSDGRHVAFQSSASNLVSGDASGPRDIYIRDLHTGATERVSVASDGTRANAGSEWPALSADGRYVVFSSPASNLVPGDTNEMRDVFVRDRGPLTGVGEIRAIGQPGGGVSVTGWTTFSGHVLASVAHDGELGGASLTYRPEQGDLFARLQAPTMPRSLHHCQGVILFVSACASTGPGTPGLLYGLAFDFDGVRYEARALRWPTTASPTAPHFALYRCDQGCTEQVGLTGGIGSTGPEVVMSLPLDALPAEQGATLTGVRAFMGVGEAASGPLVTIDEVVLPDVAIPQAHVTLGVAPAGASEADVEFDTEAALADGLFSGTLELDAGSDSEVWAKACLGDVCGMASVPVVR